MSLSKSVLNTLSYTACYDFPLTSKELWYWLLVDKPVPQSTLTAHLRVQKLPTTLKRYLIPELTKKRLQMAASAAQKIKQSQKTLDILKKIPLVRYIGLTGSLSMDSYTPKSDVDLMLITSPGTLWLTRVLVVVLLLFNGIPLRRPGIQNAAGTICINLYLDENALAVAQNKQNFYVAHEILQIKTLYDAGGYYQAFLKNNSWVKNFYANAYQARNHPVAKTKQLFPSFILYLVNLLLYLVQKAYMSRKITNETISLTQAFFHPSNPYRSLSAKIKLK